MIRRPPRSTLFPYRRSSDLGDGGDGVHAYIVSSRLGLVGNAAAVPKKEIQSKVQRVLVKRGDTIDLVVDSGPTPRSEEHTSELQSQSNLVCRLLLEKKKTEE